MVAAMAVGATAAGAYSMANASDKAPTEAVLAADQAVLGGAVNGAADGMQIVSVAPAANSSVHAEEIVKEIEKGARCQVAQVIGHTLVIYRRRAENPKIVLPRIKPAKAAVAAPTRRAPEPEDDDGDDFDDDDAFDDEDDNEDLE